MVEAHTSAVLEKGFAHLLQAHRIDDLQRLHGLLARVDRLDKLRAAFANHLRTSGAAVVKDEDNDAHMVQHLLDMKVAAAEVVAGAFGGGEVFNNAMKEAFESFVNCRQNRPAELIAKFIDAKLRAGNKSASDEELEATLDKTLGLFRYIQGKDVFEVRSTRARVVRTHRCMRRLTVTPRNKGCAFHLISLTRAPVPCVPALPPSGFLQKRFGQAVVAREERFDRCGEEHD